MTATNSSATARTPFWRRIRWRSLLSFVSLALAILCLIVGSLFVWVRISAYSPDGFVSSALSVQGQVEVQNAVVNYVQDNVVTEARAEKAAASVVDELPISDSRKAFLTTVVATSLRTQVANITRRALETGRARSLIEKVSTRAGEAVVDLLQNRPGVLQFQGTDTIIFNTEPLVKDARAAVDEQLGSLAKYLPAPIAAEAYPTYVVASGSAVTTTQQIIKFVDLMAWLLPVLFVLLLILGIVLARERRSAAYRSMIAIAVAAIVVLVALRIAKTAIASLLSEPATQQVYDAILTEVSSRLLDQTLLLALLAAIVATTLWLFGPDRLAKRSRAWVGRRWHDLQVGAPAPAGRFTQFAREFPRHLEIGGLAIAIIVLLAIPSVTASTWISATVALVLWFLAIEYTRTAGWMVGVAARMRRKDSASA